MHSKVYSHLTEIPSGKAGSSITEGCLVLEGGAFRGLYTQGFLDAMMVNDINMRCTIGVSAGALGGMNYVAGQIGRSARTNLRFRHDSRYVGAKAVVHSHSLLDVSFLTEERGILEPLDKERFMQPDRQFIAVATNCLNGKAAYFEKGRCSDILQAVRASATMPFISPMVKIDGIPYLDGGCSCKIPYRWALKKGFKKIIVIKTRESASWAIALFPMRSHAMTSQAIPSSLLQMLFFLGRYLRLVIGSYSVSSGQFIPLCSPENV